MMSQGNGGGFFNQTNKLKYGFPIMGEEIGDSNDVFRIPSFKNSEKRSSFSPIPDLNHKSQFMMGVRPTTAQSPLSLLSKNGRSPRVSPSPNVMIRVTPGGQQPMSGFVPLTPGQVLTSPFKKMNGTGLTTMKNNFFMKNRLTPRQNPRLIDGSGSNVFGQTESNQGSFGGFGFGTHQ